MPKPKGVMAICCVLGIAKLSNNCHVKEFLGTAYTYSTAANSRGTLFVLTSISKLLLSYMSRINIR